jgi:septal ring factor EnvC (AmiA/AmiB activator)
MGRRLFICAILGAGLMTGAAASAPQSNTTMASPELQQVEAGERQREQDRDSALAEAQAAKLEIAQLQAQLDALNAAQKNGESSVSDKKLRLAALNVRQAQLDGQLGAAQSKLSRLLGALELFRREPPPALFVDPHDVRDAVRAAILIKAITPELEKQAAVLKAQAETLRRLKRAVDTASEDLFTSESDVADRRAKIEALIAAKAVLEDQDTANAEAARQDAEAYGARARTLRELSQGLAVMAPPANSAEPPDPEHSGLFGHPKIFAAPVQGAPFRRFGETDAGGAGRSLGWTWRTAGSANVVSPAQAVVDYAGPLKAWNVVVILRLGGGYHLVLAGLDSAQVSPGQSLKEGQVVGHMGGTDANPPELYFEIRKNGAPVDPAHWLKAPEPPLLRH